MGRIFKKFELIFEKLLKIMATYNEDVLIFGHLNFHLKSPDDTDAQKFFELLSSHGFESSVNKPTHRQGGWLDVVASKTMLKIMATYNEDVLIFGHLNFHLKSPDDTDAQKFFELLSSHGFESSVNKPTHRQGGWLDVVASKTMLKIMATYNEDVLIFGHLNFHLKSPDDTDAQKFFELLSSHGFESSVNKPTHRQGGWLDVVASKTMLKIMATYDEDVLIFGHLNFHLKFPDDTDAQLDGVPMVLFL